MRPLLLVLSLLAAGCGPHEHEHAEEAHHAHAPRYGGTLIEIGEHFAQVELVHDPAGGGLEAYVWDGHVEHAVPLSMKALAIAGEADKKAFKLELRPVEDQLAGEGPGHASHFAGRSELLRGAKRIQGSIAELAIKGRTFERIAFEIGG